MPKELKMGSFNPDDFASGRPDDFDGVITAAVVKAWRWPGSQADVRKYQLFASITFQPDDGEEFEENYLAGWLNQGIPSPDGKVPAGGISADEYAKLGNGDLEIEEGDEEKYQGKYVLGAFSRNTNFEQFVASMRECGFTAWTNSIDQFVGVRAHFVRLPQVNKPKPRKGETGDQREFKVLVPSEIYKDKGAKASVSAAAKPAAAPSVTTEVEKSDDDLTSRIELVIYEKVAAAGDEGFPKAKLGQLMLNNFKKVPGGVNELAVALAFIQDPANLATFNSMNYEPTTGMLTVA